MSKDKLKQSQYDGIQEYDNDLPVWWVGTFVLTVLFGFGYWVYYYNFNGPGQIQAFDQAYQVHQKKYSGLGDQQGLNDEMLLAMVDSSKDLAAGEKIYAQNCVACHTASGGGSIGPNLTDGYWIHGDAPMSMYKTIEQGVVEKGMLSWKGILTSKQIQQVTAYVLTMKDTNVAGGKEPQGIAVE